MSGGKVIVCLLLAGMAASGKILSWTDGEKKITVTFVNDKVVAKTQSGL